jgi:hypothetical protein
MLELSTDDVEAMSQVPFSLSSRDGSCDQPPRSGESGAAAPRPN